MELDYKQLNKSQYDAMVDTEGAILVLAGAGSGKTRVLTHRVAHLVMEKGVSPYHILAITFTNKATHEMKNRLNAILGEDNSVWISTFHSLCASILRRHGDKLGYNSNFSIYDDSDSLRTIKKALKEYNLDGESIKDSIKSHISIAKNKGLSPDGYFAIIRGEEKYDDEIHKLYSRYEQLLKSSNAMDFDDLLHKTKALFLEHPDILDKYQQKFRYIHVDEFQDTNTVQYELVQMLSAKWGNIFVVGDDDQSIYGWRGADITNILNFDKVYPNAKIYKLLENYRSTTKILDVANNVIKHNKARHEKELFTNCGDGVRVEYHTAYNDYQEADWVVDTMMSLKRFNGYTNSDFAILVRANSLSRLFENKLSRLGQRYQVLGGFKFFDRKEIQDVIAYMRVVSNKLDNEALERIINFPRRGIGDTTVQQLTNHAMQSGNSLLDTVLNIGSLDILRGATAKKVADFAVLMQELQNKSTLPLVEFSEYLVKRVGFEFAYSATGKEEDINRWENIQEFLRHIKEYAGENFGADLNQFLQTITLQPERANELQDPEHVTIATMHAVKGLEFRAVFIVGCEEEVFPSSQAIRDGDVEEERRVMYVAITRAKERLYITNTRQRFRYNRVQSYMPSRFIAESKGKNENTYDSYDDNSVQRDMAYNNTATIRQTAFANKPRSITPFQPPKPTIHNKDTSGFVSGAKVKHNSYGEGTIILLQGEGTDATATVVFPKLGIKKFKVALAPLKIVD